MSNQIRMKSILGVVSALLWLNAGHPGPRPEFLVRQQEPAAFAAGVKRKDSTVGCFTMKDAVDRDKLLTIVDGEEDPKGARHTGAWHVRDRQMRRVPDQSLQERRE